MKNKTIKQFVKERDEAVASFDLEVFKRFYARWTEKGFYKIPLPENDYIIENAMRKMALEITSISAEKKKEAYDWLIAHNSRPMFEEGKR